MLCRKRPTPFPMHEQKADILTQRPSRLGVVHQLIFGGLLLIVPALTVLTAFGIAPGAALSFPYQTLVQIPLGLPEEPAPPENAERFVTQERVLRGDTVAALFERLGVRDSRALDFLRTDVTGRVIFRQLVPGRMLQAETGNSGELIALRYFLSAASLLEVTRGTQGLEARHRKVSEPPRLVHRTATIRSSLFAATDAAGIPDAIAMQVARVFATDIDFHVDLRKGDRVSIVYEMIYDSGELVAPGRILAAEFVNRGNTLRAFLWQDTDGTDTWYSADGRSTRGTFLRAPMEFSRITSGFSLARFHPILQKWRAHKGVDYAAPTGTPIRATADGVVTFAGVQGGYGNVVFLRHHSAYSTVYGHMSRFAPQMRQGTRVRQGETIGYVGMTGWATGPHLHYEFRVADEPRNPLNVALPAAQPITLERLAAFKDATRPAQDALALARSLPATALASTE